MAKGKERLDKLLVQRGLAESRAKAQAYIMAGEVLVNGEPALKAGMTVPLAAELTVKESLQFASRGGLKLDGALDEFAIQVAGRVAADVGACTGGFTDVLLQRDVARVYAIDVGYGQLNWRVRQDERVEVMERTNARYLESLAEPVSLVVIDVSFISLRLILPAVRRWLTPDFDVVALIKPQFEAGRQQVGKGGIVKDPAVHREVVAELLAWVGEVGMAPAGLIRSPIKGSDGNVEYLVWLCPPERAALAVPAAIDAVLAADEE